MQRLMKVLALTAIVGVVFCMGANAPKKGAKKAQEKAPQKPAQQFQITLQSVRRADCDCGPVGWSR